MLEKIPQLSIRPFYLTGIIPAHQQGKSNFGTPWHDFLTPIGHDYTIIERAVYATAWAGCSSIWIVCSDDNLLLLRKRVGNWIYDPESLLRAMILRKKSTTGLQRITKIPIIYVPIHPKDIGRRDGMVWSVLWGAKVAYHVSGRLSTWAYPDSYFVYFPQMIVPIGAVKSKRTLMKRNRKKLFFSYEGKTIRDGVLLPFTFTGKEYNIMRDAFKKKATGKYEKFAVYKNPPDFKNDFVPLPIEERYSGRFMPPEDVFGELIIEEEDTIKDIGWALNVGTWEGYRDALTSYAADYFRRPMMVMGKSSLNAKKSCLVDDIETLGKYTDFLKKEEKNG